MARPCSCDLQDKPELAVKLAAEVPAVKLAAEVAGAPKELMEPIIVLEADGLNELKVPGVVVENGAPSGATVELDVPDRMDEPPLIGDTHDERSPEAVLKVAPKPGLEEADSPDVGVADLIVVTCDGAVAAAVGTFHLVVVIVDAPAIATDDGAGLKDLVLCWADG